MVQIEKEKVVIEIEEPFPGDYIRELHNSLCKLICGYDSETFPHENIQVVADFIKELMPCTEELDRVCMNNKNK